MFCLVITGRPPTTTRTDTLVPVTWRFRANAPVSVSNILAQLATTSSRPRYAFAVLALLAEQAGPTGKTEPFITDEDEEKLPLREYVGKRLARMPGRDSTRLNSSH